MAEYLKSFNMFVTFKPRFQLLGICPKDIILSIQSQLIYYKDVHQNVIYNTEIVKGNEIWKNREMIK